MAKPAPNPEPAHTGRVRPVIARPLTPEELTAAVIEAAIRD